MRLLYKLCLLGCLIPCVLIGQASLDSWKCWNAKDNLTWKDFKGKIPISEFSSNKIAVCPNEIIAKGFWEEGKPNFYVRVYFLKNLAWTKDTTSMTTLAHEQLHFDIGELYARKIRKKIKELRRESELNVSIYGDFINRFMSEKEEMNLRYDYETAHGIYKSKQKEWEFKIAGELDMLFDYASKDDDCIAL